MLKKKVTKTKSTTAKTTKQLTPLEKARLAKKNGSTNRARPTYPTWKAPVDFKSHILEVVVKTDKDGLLGPAIRLTRYKGQFDPNCDPRKKWIVNEYDTTTCMGVLSRLSMVTFVTNQAKRLPPLTKFRIVMRVSMSKAKGDIITITFKEVAQFKESKTGRVKAIVLDKKDPIYRKFRKSARLLPSAFAKVLMPPKKGRSTKAEE